MDDLRKNYAAKINQDVASEGIYDKTTKIKNLQRLFKTGDTPIYLKHGVNDMRIYRGAMIASVVGLGLTLLSIGMMATNTMPKKEK